MATAEGFADGEVLVLSVHQHWRTVLRPALILAATVAAAVALLVSVPVLRDVGTGRLVLGLTILAVLLIWVVQPLLRWRTTSYELTNRRLRLRQGILTRTGRDFPLTQISDVSFAQGLMDRLLGCGRLIVESPGERGELVLTEIPRVQRVQAVIFQLVEDERNRLAAERSRRERPSPQPG